jgi:hypothetical protein
MQLIQESLMGMEYRAPKLPVPQAVYCLCLDDDRVVQMLYPDEEIEEAA